LIALIEAEKMKQISLAIMLFAFAVLLLGCALPQSDAQSLAKLSTLKEQYSVTKAFSTKMSTMSNYISELALLRGKSSGDAAKIIDAELYSAQTFYYLNQSMQNSKQIDYISFQCRSKEVTETISLIKIAQQNSFKAIQSIQNLTDAQKKSLRENQLETIEEYARQITNLKAFFDEKC
jgi:Leucine-rich repeat (LRR) protein